MGGGAWERELVVTSKGVPGDQTAWLQIITAAVGKWSLRADGKGGRGV